MKVSVVLNATSADCFDSHNSIPKAVNFLLENNIIPYVLHEDSDLSSLYKELPFILLTDNNCGNIYQEFKDNNFIEHDYLLRIGYGNDIDFIKFQGGNLNEYSVKDLRKIQNQEVTQTEAIVVEDLGSRKKARL